MKIMIFGALASGKSTFARKLGAKLNVPVIHLDEAVHKLGGHQNASAIQKFIKEQVKAEHWIMDGNVLSKDKHERIKHADIIILLNVNSFRAFVTHLYRHAQLKRGKTKSLFHNPYKTLDLWFCINYVFWEFPYLRYQALQVIKTHGKKPVVIKSWKQAQRYIDNFGK
jgi:adenylate kinase family enzyme